MYLDFGHTPDGFIKVEAQALASVVSRHLPRGAQCSAIRLRAHDRLCLVVISDGRTFWSREDDQRRAKAIADDLRSIGMDLPRIRWIRQGQTTASETSFSSPVYFYPCFWGAAAGCLCAFTFLPWQSFMICVIMSFVVWLAASWLITGGGFDKILGAVPLFRKR